MGIARDWPAGHPTRGATKRNACSNCTTCTTSTGKKLQTESLQRYECVCVCVCRYFLNPAEVPPDKERGREEEKKRDFLCSAGWGRPTAVAFFSPWQALRAHAGVKSWQTSGLKQALFGASGLVFFIPDMSCHAWSVFQTCLNQQQSKRADFFSHSPFSSFLLFLLFEEQKRRNCLFI